MGKAPPRTPVGDVDAPADVFDTATLRRRVLDAWSASPARFREDANVEEDFALGGYRDRLVVELAQNAADAAARAGVLGRVAFVLRDGLLAVANTGAPLDAAGVESLSTMRASAKRGEDTVGRFGVGFAAVLAVSDEPAVLSTSGGVRWSRSEAYALVDALPSLHAEVAARGGHVPVLRLPLPAAGRPPSGFDTVVVLPLRDAAADDLVRRLLSDVDVTLPLLLPGLVEVTIDVDGRERRIISEHADHTAVIDDDGILTTWRVASASGRLEPALLADRPAEERARPGWWVTCAVPVDGEDRPQPLDAVAAVVRAPTATDEPLSLPVVLAASFPLDPTRRHVAEGPLRDVLVARAADVYADLVRALPSHPEVLSLVPVGMAASALDAALRRAVLEVLPETAFLPSAEQPAVTLRPRDAVAVEDPLVPVLRDVVPGVLAPGWTGGWREAALAVLGVRRPSLADIVEALSGLEREPRWWHDLYAGLAAALPPGPERDALGAVPVPLADGRIVTGPRGALVAADDVVAEVAEALQLRVVHPDAAHPLLVALGAVPATPTAVLDEPAVRAAVVESYDAEDPEPVAEAVLSLVQAAGLTAPAAATDRPWLTDLALPADDGDWLPAGELLLPGGRLAGVVAADAPFGVLDAAIVERWGRDVVTAVGVLDTFAVARAPDVLAGADTELHLDAEDEWLETLPSGAVVAELVAVRDLELVRHDAWPQVLRLLAVPPLRSAVVEPATVLLPADGSVRVPSYTSWWLSRHRVLNGQRPADVCAPDADPRLRGLFDEAVDVGLDRDFLTAIGVVASLEDARPDDVLARLADPQRAVARDDARALHAWLSVHDVAPAARVRAVADGVLRVVDADDAVVVDAPDLLPLVGRRAVVPVPLERAVALAEVLDLALASEVAAGEVVSGGEPRPVPDAVAAVPGAPTTFVEHAHLEVTGAEGAAFPVAWRWVDGVLHVDARQRARGIGRGVAWAAGCWSRRHELTELVAQPEDSEWLAAERDLDGA